MDVLRTLSLRIITTMSHNLISARRDEVLKSYECAKAINRRKFLEGDCITGFSEYIYQNQIEDAINVVNKFYTQKCRVVSIQKKTKIGADGLMIEIAKILTTHSDDNFVVNPANVRIITGMNNVSWERSMKQKAPSCFEKGISHHGKLPKVDLKNLKNSLIIIDEIDSANGEQQVLHRILKEAGVLDVKHMTDNNNLFVFISATMYKELHDLYRWGDIHDLYTMTIPKSYIGHKDFLEKGIIQESYPLKSQEKCDKWIQEDILDNYGNDYRVHIVRVNKIYDEMVHNACIRKGVEFHNHTSNDRLSETEINELFQSNLSKHIVICVKGFFRRADLIPNCWKLRIGATHEQYTSKVDYNVQVQGLPGRMTGYWREDIESGHKTGPYRTSVKAIKEYEQAYDNPFGSNSYQTAGFTKKNGIVTSKNNTMLSVNNITNLEPVDFPIVRQVGSVPVVVVFDVTEEEKRLFGRQKYEEMLDVLRKYDKNAYEQYKMFKIRCWNIDTTSKAEKWGLSNMLKPNAYSSETNVKNKQKNEMMIYLHENKLIFNPWCGQL